jgi:hypothetical protein
MGDTHPIQRERLESRPGLLNEYLGIPTIGDHGGQHRVHGGLASGIPADAGIGV